MHIQAKKDAQERYTEQKEMLKDLKHCLYEVSLSLAILDRHAKNHGSYVDISDVAMHSMRATVELYKGIVQTAIED